jgi:heme A synthase
MKCIRIVAWVATVVTYCLIALGGTVLATNSGLSCPDWPLCYGQAYYAGTYHVFLEQFHRFTAATVSILIVLLAIGILRWARHDRALLTMGIAAPILLAMQIVLGGLTVLWKLPPQIIMAHLGTALAILAVVITIAVLSGKSAPMREHPAKTRTFAQLAITNALLVYILMLHFHHLRQPAQRGASLFRSSLLRLRVHARAQADHDAEYRDRRRCRSSAGAGRLGSHRKHPEPASSLDVCHHLLLDATTLLGALAADPERLREGRYPHAAGGQG